MKVTQTRIWMVEPPAKYLDIEHIDAPARNYGFWLTFGERAFWV
jgi:hypothetical protein